MGYHRHMSHQSIAPGSPTNGGSARRRLLSAATRRGRPRSSRRMLLVNTEQGLSGGVIVETEAYLGADDPGVTRRRGDHRAQRGDVRSGWNSLRVLHLRQPPHAEPRVLRRGDAGAVLIRALEPLVNIDRDEKPPTRPTRRRAVQRARQAHRGARRRPVRQRHGSRLRPDRCTLAPWDPSGRWQRQAGWDSRQVTISNFATIGGQRTCRAGRTGPSGSALAFH